MGQQRTLWTMAAVLGSVMILGSLLGILVVIVLPILSVDEGQVGFLILGASLMLLGLGVLLGLAGLSVQQDWPVRRFYPRRIWLVFLILTVIVTMIALLIPSSWQMSSWFALLHLMVIMCSALGLLSIAVVVGGDVHAPTFRQLALTLNSGALSTLLALPLELIGLFLGLFLVAVLAMFFPGGQMELERLMDLMQRWMNNTALVASSMDETLSFMASPVVLGVMALTLGVVTPFVEELGKTLALGFRGRGEPPTLTQAFLWGAMCGVGFAIVEGFFNGAMGLGDTFGWLGGVATRVPATAMHALTSGLIGLGWGFFWRERRRWWALLAMYLIAMIFHGVWNFNVVLMLGSTAMTMQGPPWWGVLSVLGLGIQGVLALFSPLALIGIPLFLRKRESNESGRITG